MFRCCCVFGSDFGFPRFEPDYGPGSRAMKFQRFLIGFIAVLLLFGIVTYVLSQNIWTTLVQTLICAFVIQLGYFLIIVAMVKIRRRRSSSQSNAEEDNGSGKSSPVLHAPRLKHTR